MFYRNRHATDDDDDAWYVLLLTENCSKFKLNFFLNFRKKIALQAYKSSRIFASIDNLSVAGIEADRVPEIVQNDCFLLLRKAAIVCRFFRFQTQTPCGFLLVGTAFSNWRGDPSIRRPWPDLWLPKIEQIWLTFWKSCSRFSWIFSKQVPPGRLVHLQLVKNETAFEKIVTSSLKYALSAHKLQQSKCRKSCGKTSLN